MKELNEMSLKELFELQKRLGRDIEIRVRIGEDIRKRKEARTLTLDSEESIQGFLDSLVGETIKDFKVLTWATDPEFRIVTDKRSFTLHANDIGVFIDNAYVYLLARKRVEKE